MCRSFSATGRERRAIQLHYVKSITEQLPTDKHPGVHCHTTLLGVVAAVHVAPLRVLGLEVGPGLVNVRWRERLDCRLDAALR